MTKEENKPTEPKANYWTFCPEDEDGKRRFKPQLVADWLKANYHFKTDKATDMLFYGDDETGIWQKRGEVFLKQILARILGLENRKAHYNNILHDLKSITYEDIVFSKKIACENGFLDPVTMDFTKPTLDEMVYYHIPVIYNLNVDPSKLMHWLEFLKQVASADDIPFLQEWSGYLLLTEYMFHYALWIHGKGRNGKGVYDRTMKGILGEGNVVGVGLEELDGSHRFALANYYGKLYAVSSEPVTNKIFRTELFQKLTGGDLIEAELKGVNDRLKFVNCAKLTIIGNKFPKIHNPTIAFTDRMRFVEFAKYFSEKERTPNLERVWLNDPEQKSAILNWMLAGLQRLLSQCHFTQSKSQKETEILFERTSDTVGSFQKEMGMYSKEFVITRTKAYEAYADYCEAIGVIPESKPDFTQQMQRLAPKVKDGYTREDGKKVRAWIGIVFKILDGLNLNGLPQTPQTQQALQTPQDSRKSVHLDHLDQHFTPMSFGEKNEKVVQVKEDELNEPNELNSVECSEKRYCFDDCKCFRTEKCTAPNPLERSKDAELPLNCPRHKWILDYNEE